MSKREKILFLFHVSTRVSDCLPGQQELGWNQGCFGGLRLCCWKSGSIKSASPQASPDFHGCQNSELEQFLATERVGGRTLATHARPNASPAAATSCSFGGMIPKRCMEPGAGDPGLSGQRGSCFAPVPTRCPPRVGHAARDCKAWHGPQLQAQGVRVGLAAGHVRPLGAIAGSFVPQTGPRGSGAAGGREGGREGIREGGIGAGRRVRSARPGRGWLTDRRGGCKMAQAARPRSR